jgi:hypothetical protein
MNITTNQTTISEADQRLGRLSAAKSVESVDAQYQLFDEARAANDAEMLQALAQNGDLGNSLKELLAQSEDETTVCYIAASLFLPQTLQLKLKDHPSLLVRANLAANETVLPLVQDYLLYDAHLMVRAMLSMNKSLTPHAARKAVEDAHPYIRELLAKSSALPQDSQAQLAARGNTEVCRLLAERGDLLEKVEASLVAMDLNEVTGALCKNPNIREATQLKIIEKHNHRWTDAILRLPSCSKAARQLVSEIKEAEKEASKTNLPADRQKELAESKFVSVRAKLANNPSVVSDVQHYLKYDTVEAVRCYLAFNRSVTPEVQESLADDKSSRVVDYLMRNCAITESVALDLYARDVGIMSLICNKSLPARVLNTMLSDLVRKNDAHLVVVLIKFHDLSEEQQLNVLNMSSNACDMALSESPATTPNVLRKLYARGNVFSELMRRKDLPEDIQERVIEDRTEASWDAALAACPALTDKMAIKLAKNSGHIVQAKLANRNPMPEELLRFLFDGGVPEVARQLGVNPSVPERIRNLLKEAFPCYGN